MNLLDASVKMQAAVTLYGSHVIYKLKSSLLSRNETKFSVVQDHVAARLGLGDILDTAGDGINKAS
jgi:hypothetical protein